MAFELEFLPDADKQLRRLGTPTIQRILKKLSWITKQDNPLRHSVILHDATIGNIRFRIGDYRAVAYVDHVKKKIFIAAVGHRREIYR